MNLIVDIGNSFVKLAVFQEQVLLEKRVVEKAALGEDLGKIFLELPEIGRAIVSSVAESPEKWADSWSHLQQVVLLQPNTPLPFVNRYTTPERLGNDRKALVAAAASHFPKEPVLVIDAGTCITYDFKNEQNEYLGGGISPGLRMRYKALNAFTARLPLLEPKEEVSLIGNSSEHSIHSGVICGAAREIDGMVAEYREAAEGLKIILTGGDAHFLSLQLKNTIFATSNFLVEGLNHILEFNSIP